MEKKREKQIFASTLLQSQENNIKYSDLLTMQNLSECPLTIKAVKRKIQLREPACQSKEKRRKFDLGKKPYERKNFAYFHKRQPLPTRMML